MYPDMVIVCKNPITPFWSNVLCIPSKCAAAWPHREPVVVLARQHKVTCARRGHQLGPSYKKKCQSRSFK